MRDRVDIDEIAYQNTMTKWYTLLKSNDDEAYEAACENSDIFIEVVDTLDFGTEYDTIMKHPYWKIALRKFTIKNVEFRSFLIYLMKIDPDYRFLHRNKIIKEFRINL